MSPGLLLPPNQVGLIRINDHCRFTWRAVHTPGAAEVPLFIEATTEHCRACVEEALARGFGIVDGRDAGEMAPRPTPSMKH